LYVGNNVVLRYEGSLQDVDDVFFKSRSLQNKHYPVKAGFFV